MAGVILLTKNAEGSELPQQMLGDCCDHLCLPRIDVRQRMDLRLLFVRMIQEVGVVCNFCSRYPHIVFWAFRMPRMQGHLPRGKTFSNMGSGLVQAAY